MIRRLLGLSLVAIVLACGGCANKRVVSGSIDRSRLFPCGTYRHSVVVSIPSQKKTFRLQGIVEIRSATIRLYALSPFGTTAFRIRDDLLRNDVVLDIYMDEIKAQEARIREFYGEIRKVLISPQPQPDGGTVGYEIRKVDRNGIPERISLIHPRFTAEIQVTGYEI